MAVKHIIATQPPCFIALNNKQKMFTTSFKKLHKSNHVYMQNETTQQKQNQKVNNPYLFIIMNIHEFKYALPVGKISFPLYGCTDV